MYCIINMYNSKRLYRFKRNDLNCLNYEGDCFDNEGCEFKIKIVVGK